MEKPLYPSPYMRITQGYNIGSHKGSFAIDEAGSDTGIDNILAPFTGVVKKVYTSDANEVWLESLDKVEYPDGTIDYMTILFAHDNNVNNLYIGKVIKKGEPFYQEGTKGIATGNHCHFECGKGKFTGSGWYKNNYGTWVINNGKDPTECLWIDDSIKILNSNGYTFKKIESEHKEEQEPDNDQPDNELPDNSKEPPSEDEENKDDTTNSKLIFTCQKDDIYAIRLKKGQKLYLE